MKYLIELFLLNGFTRVGSDNDSHSIQANRLSHSRVNKRIGIIKTNKNYFIRLHLPGSNFSESGVYP
jgi:hypothetical protein